MDREKIEEMDGITIKWIPSKLGGLFISCEHGDFWLDPPSEEDKAQPESEKDIAVFNDHLIPVTEEQLKDGGFDEGKSTMISEKMCKEIAIRKWEEYWEEEGQHWGNPEVVKDFPSWLKESN